MKPSGFLFRHRLRFWSDVIVRDATTRRDERKFTEAFECPGEIQADRRNLVTLAPGETEVGRWNGYVPADAGKVTEGMVCEVYEGPEAVRFLKVQESYEPRSRFQQLKLSNWEGDLSAIGGSS